MKSKIKVKDYQVFVTIKIPYKQKFDISQYELLSGKYKYGFFKITKVKRNKLEFCCPIGISLYERLTKPISEYDFFFIIEQLVDIIQKIDELKLPIENLVLDLKYIFFNESAKELSLIYLPLSLPNKNINIIDFIETIIYLVKPNDLNKSNYLSKFSYFLKKLDKLDTKEIEMYIHQVNKEILDTIKDNHNMDEYYNNNSKVKFNFISDDEKTDLMNDSDDEKTDLMNDEGTEMLEVEDKKTFYKFPKLIRVLTNEVIEINKPVFRIGKEENCVDYIVTNNVAISRSHIDIISRSGKYFVFDLRSKNKSYINNRVLPAEHEVEIFDGDVLKLANEDFLFKCNDD